MGLVESRALSVGRGTGVGLRLARARGIMGRLGSAEREQERPRLSGECVQGIEKDPRASDIVVWGRMAGRRGLQMWAPKATPKAAPKGVTTNFVRQGSTETTCDHELDCLAKVLPVTTNWTAWRKCLAKPLSESV